MSDFKIILACKTWEYQDFHEEVVGYFFGRKAAAGAMKAINEDIKNVRNNEYRGYLLNAKRQETKFDWDDVSYNYFLIEQDVVNTNTAHNDKVYKAKVKP